MHAAARNPYDARRTLAKRFDLDEVETIVADNVPLSALARNVMS
jgi:hypothetical protein